MSLYLCSLLFSPLCIKLCEQATLEKAEAELEQRRRVGNVLGSHVGGLHLSQLENKEWLVFDEHAKSLKGDINVWDRIHEKVGSSRSGVDIVSLGL